MPFLFDFTRKQRISSFKMTDWEFVFDGVVGFLTSPMWNMPIVSFIEKHCIGKYVNVFLCNMLIFYRTEY